MKLFQCYFSFMTNPGSIYDKVTINIRSNLIIKYFYTKKPMVLLISAPSYPQQIRKHFMVSLWTFQMQSIVAYLN